MKRLSWCLLLSGLLTGSAALSQPQSSSEITDAILVFDASGSMWGQIDGVNKIVIARDVVASHTNRTQCGLDAIAHLSFWAQLTL